MATYKVLQDIEAEDKLLGPLTLKQFIFAILTIGIGFIEFKLATAGGPAIVRLPFILLFLPFMLVLGFLAAPISRDQPNDVWLLARLRFLIRPHARIWNQDGISELVTITVPKKVEHALTNGLDQTEVKSRLSALANTLDSRGWAVKNVTTNLYAQPDYINTVDSDRLIGPSALPQDVPAIDITNADDILDTDNNQIAQHLDQMIAKSAQNHLQSVASQIQAPQPQQQTPTDYWFMNEPSAQTQAAQIAQAAPAPDYTMFGSQPVVAPGAPAATVSAAPVTADENALLEKIHHNQEVAAPAYGALPKLQPLHDRNGNVIPQPLDPQMTATNPALTEPPKPETTTPNPAILGLAQRDDLNVSTIARQAQAIEGKPEADKDDEVVISLHQ